MKTMKVTYTCDECGTVLSESSQALRHLSLALGGFCGWVESDASGKWRHLHSLPNITSAAGLALFAMLTGEALAD